MPLSITDIENILDIYTIEEILEQNDLTVADALEFLSEQEFLELPDPRPVTLEPSWDTHNPELLDER